MTKRQIRAKDIINDIHAGKTDQELAEKYGISLSALEMVLEKLAAAGAISQEEIKGRASMIEDPQSCDPLRSMSRNYIFFTIPIYDADDLNVEGSVIDISEHGLQIEGVETTVGDKRCLLIRVDEFADVFPFVFDATCKWVQTSCGKGPLLAGFEIDSISEGGSKELRKLIGLLTF